MYDRLIKTLQARARGEEMSELSFEEEEDLREIRALKKKVGRLESELKTERARADKLVAALGQALGEWAIYANKVRNVPISEGKDPEARMYQKDDAALAAYQQARGE